MRILRALLVCAVATALSATAHAADTDGDGVADPFDNCLERANADQRDTNLDGYGNLCDADFDDDGGVNSGDFINILTRFGLSVPPAPPEVDMTGDDLVGMPDMIEFRNAEFGLPGPSGLGCAGTIPCSANAVPGPGPLAIGFGALSILAAAARGFRRRGPTRRAALVAGIGAILLLGASPVEAQVRLDLVWSATTGSGTPGGSSIQAQAGDTLTAQLFLVQDTQVVCCLAFSLEFDTDLGDELDFVSASPVFDPPGFFDLTGGGIPQTIESSSSQGGQVLTPTANFDVVGQNTTSATFLVGEAVFLVTTNVATDGADVVSGAFNTGFDAIGARPNPSPPGTRFEDVTSTVVFGTLSVDAP